MFWLLCRIGVMTDVVQILPGAGKRDASAILECARNSEFSHVTIVGRDEEGNMFLSASYADPAEILWDLEMAKFRLMGE